MNAEKTKTAAALAMYPLAYLYVWVLFSDLSSDARAGALSVFVFGYFLLTEALNRENPRSGESLLWLGCLLTVLLSVVLERGRVWEGVEVLAFLHIFAVWWALSRAGALAEGESSSLLPLDALHGFVVFPFGGFFLRLRTLVAALRRRPGERKRTSREALGWSAAALAAGCFLLWMAAGLLSAADEGFAALLSGVLDRLRWEWSPEQELILLRLLFSLPVGAYLYGLLAGSAGANREALRREAEGCRGAAAHLRRVPSGVWTALVGLFCLLYLLFFAVQFRYLFGAFRRMLPEGFIVSEYARRGFFELCRVMAVNFTLLWLALRTSGEDGKRHALKLFCLLLLAESLLLAAVAFSKLYLYISCFGFTPKRLQSTWLVCLLAFGCLCAGASLLAGKKTFRLWMAFGAVTLSLLCLY